MATGNENDAVNYVEQSFHILLAGKIKANGMLSQLVVKQAASGQFRAASAAAASGQNC